MSFLKSVSFIFTFCALLCSLGCKMGNSQLTPGTAAPEFELLDIDGKNVKLSDFRNKAILLVFFASWCKPCRDEAPTLEKLHRTMGDKGLQLLSVAIDDDIEALKSFRETYSITFPILNDVNGRVRSMYSIKGIPESYIINKEGKLTLVEDPVKGPILKITGPREWTDGNVQDAIMKAAGLLTQ